MRETLDKLWNEYFAEDCMVIDTEEERALLKRIIEMQKSVNELLASEERCAIEKYIGVLYEMQSLSVKKVFFKGCEFALSFLLLIWSFRMR